MCGWCGVGGVADSNYLDQLWELDQYFQVLIYSYSHVESLPIQPGKYSISIQTKVEYQSLFYATTAWDLIGRRIGHCCRLGIYAYGEAQKM